MSYYNTFLHNAAFHITIPNKCIIIAIHIRSTCLSYHLTQRSLRSFRIIPCIRILQRKLTIHILKIRKIYIHKSIHNLKCINIFIGTCIVYDRYLKPPVLSLYKCLCYLSCIMCRCNKIDIVSLIIL